MLKKLLYVACLWVVIAEDRRELEKKITNFTSSVESDINTLYKHCNENERNNTSELLEIAKQQVTLNITELENSLVKDINDLKTQTGSDESETCVQNLTILERSHEEAVELFSANIVPLYDCFTKNCMDLSVAYEKLYKEQKELRKKLDNCNEDDANCLTEVGELLRKSKQDLSNKKGVLYEIVTFKDSFGEGVAISQETAITNVTNYAKTVFKGMHNCLMTIILAPEFDKIDASLREIHSNLQENIVNMKKFTKTDFGESITKIINEIFGELASGVSKTQDEITTYYNFAQDKQVNVSTCLENSEEIASNAITFWTDSRKNCNDQINNTISKSSENIKLLQNYQYRYFVIKEQLDGCQSYDDTAVFKILNDVDNFSFMNGIISESLEETSVNEVLRRLEKIKTVQVDDCTEKNEQIKDKILNCIFNKLHSDCFALNPTRWLICIFVFLFLIN